VKQAIEQALSELGIPKGSALMVHSDAMVVAQFPGMGNAQGIATFWMHLEQWLAGDLLVPTFTYSPMAGACFDPALTPSKVGLMTEVFRQRDGVARTLDPIFSFAISGPHGAELAARECHDCFGQESPFGWLAEQDGWLLGLGCSLSQIVRGAGVRRRRLARLAGRLLCAGSGAGQRNRPLPAGGPVAGEGRLASDPVPAGTGLGSDLSRFHPGRQ